MADVVKRLAVLGSTGSIGRQTLNVVRALPERFLIVALAAGKNIDILAGQIREFRPKFISYLSGDEHNENKQSWLRDAGCRFLSLEDMACHPDVDIVVIATSGTAGLNATLAAVRT